MLIAFFGKMFRFVWSMEESEDLWVLSVFTSHMVGILFCIVSSQWMQILFNWTGLDWTGLDSGLEGRED